MIVNIEYHNGGHKIIPSVESMSIKEFHVIVFQEDGKTDTIERGTVDKIRIVGV